MAIADMEGAEKVFLDHMMLIPTDTMRMIQWEY